MARNPLYHNGGLPSYTPHQEWSDNEYLPDMITGPWLTRWETESFTGTFPCQTSHISPELVIEQRFPEHSYKISELSSTCYNAGTLHDARSIVSKLNYQGQPGHGADQLVGGPMERWVCNNPDEAWSVPRVIPPLPVSTKNGSYVPHTPELFSFTVYRESGHSDISSVVSGHNPQVLDSGYGTAPATHSVAGSETDKTSPEILNLFEGMQPFSGFSNSPSSLGLPTTPHTGKDNAIQSAQRDLQCSSCNEILRLPSQLKKHKLKHEKPYKYDVGGCSRVCGFATPNDLDRHKRSKHGLMAGCGPSRYWKCASRTCENKNKEWPRLDNFRQHVERMHKEEDSTSLVKRSRRTFQQDVTGFESLPNYSIPGGNATSSENLAQFEGCLHEPPRSPLEYSDPFANIGGQFAAEVAPQYPYPSSLEVLKSGPVTSQSSAFLSPSICSSMRPRIPQRYQVQPKSVGPPSLTIPIDSALTRPSLTPSTADRSQYIHVKYPQEWQRPHRSFAGSPLLETKRSVKLSTSCSQQCILENKLPHLSDTSHILKRTAPGSHGLVVNGIPCPEPLCGKVVRRNCDLRKHKRRHTRPFACTFDSCGYPFGSKNDWKRHETLQHPRNDSWRCEICASLYDSREDFVMHLQEQHELFDYQCLINECNIRRIGASGQQFWCGFCREIKNVEATVCKTSDERFDHICKHFVEEERKIKDWLPASGYRTKGEIDAAFKKYGQVTAQKKSPNLVDREFDVTSHHPTFVTFVDSARNKQLTSRDMSGPQNLEAFGRKRHWIGESKETTSSAYDDFFDYNLYCDPELIGTSDY